MFFVISTFAVLNPTTDTSIVKGGLSAAFNTKLPSKSVFVPTAFLEILILAPGINSPVFASVTVPETVVWATIVTLLKAINARNKIFFLII